MWEEGGGRSGMESRDQRVGKRARTVRARGPRTKGLGGVLGEAGAGVPGAGRRGGGGRGRVPGPRGWEMGWGRHGEGSRDQGARRWA